MPIVNIPATGTLSTADAQAKAKKKIVGANTFAYQQNLRAYQTGMDNFWRNADGLTPQQVADAFGTDAASLFQNAAAVAGLVNGIAPGAIGADADAAKYDIAINNDGTATITLKTVTA